MQGITERHGWPFPASGSFQRRMREWQDQMPMVSTAHVALQARRRILMEVILS
jgi:hypothetical protein